MPQSTNHRLNGAAALLALAFLASGAAAENQLFPSGLMRSYSRLESGAALDSEERQPLEVAFDAFLTEKFSHGEGGIRWRKASQVTDATHVHRLYELTYAGRRVLGQFVKLHYALRGPNQGTVEFASSSWSTRFLTSGIYSNPQLALSVFQSHINARFGAALPAVKSESAFLLVPGTQRIRPVMVVESKGKHPAAVNRWIVDERDGRVISEKSMVRHVTDWDGTSNCYLKSPPSDDPETVGTPDPCTLNDVESSADGSFLVGPYFHVKRGRSGGDPVNVVFKNAGVSVNYIAAPFSNVTGNYKEPEASPGVVCSDPGTTSCVNQSFDAVNVYAHLGNFRRKMITYLNTDLGVTECGTGLCFPADPLPVIVNAQPISSGGSTIASNNAAYIPNCSIFSEERCLVFFKPAAILGSECGLTGTIKLYSVAREANVIVHEFQHYVTDSITNIAFGTSSEATVGDALHEGFSDYFAASHVVAINNEDSSGAKILGHSFRNCPSITRDVATLRPFQVDSSAIYDVGLTWASGLYKLRGELPTPKDGDLLALKSQFFLTPNPGYIEAVEALVQADQTLNAGVNVARIRQLFYDELKFVNGGESPFRSTENLLAEVGFKSCTSVGMPNASGGWPSSALSWGAFFTWLVGTLASARRFTRGRR